MKEGNTEIREKRNWSNNHIPSIYMSTHVDDKRGEEDIVESEKEKHGGTQRGESIT